MSENYITTDELRTYRRWTIGQQIRKTFGIEPFTALEERLEPYEHPLPDAIVHTPQGTEWGHAGAANWFAVGEKGSGKSTLLRWLAAHLLDRNYKSRKESGETIVEQAETVVVRGSQARSEWLPLKHWVTVYLPAGLEVESRWRAEQSTLEPDNLGPVDLEDVVSEVRRYDGLEDLLTQLDAPELAVVYPDPLFRGCNRAMEESNYARKPITFQSWQAAEDSESVTPLVHWWIAFAAARVGDMGEGTRWLSLLFDEVADLLPESARADKSQTYEKIEVMRGVMADSRKYGFSFYAFGHQEKNVHHKIRSTFDWRLAMPDDEGNPCKSNNDRPPVGFNNIPMIKNFLQHRGPGYGVCWKPNAFTRFTWGNIPSWEEDFGRKLEVNLVESDAIHARVTDSEPDTGGHRREEVADD